VLRHLGVGPVDLRVIEIGTVDPGAEIVRLLFPIRLCGLEVDGVVITAVNGRSSMISAT